MRRVKRTGSEEPTRANEGTAETSTGGQSRVVPWGRPVIVRHGSCSGYDSNFTICYGYRISFGASIRWSRKLRRLRCGQAVLRSDDGHLEGRGLLGVQEPRGLERRFIRTEFTKLALRERYIYGLVWQKDELFRSYPDHRRPNRSLGRRKGVIAAGGKDIRLRSAIRESDYGGSRTVTPQGEPSGVEQASRTLKDLPLEHRSGGNLIPMEPWRIRVVLPWRAAPRQ